MIDTIVSYINNNGKFNTQKEIIENALWFTVSSYAGLCQPKIIHNGLETHLNYFGISVAPSSAGKDFSLKYIQKMFNINSSKYAESIKAGYIEATKSIDGNFADIDIDGTKVPLSSFLPNDLTINIEGTPEGLYLRALALSKSFLGSLNIVNNEIMDIVRGSNLNRMKELFDGEFNAKIIKSSINENISNINANMLLFGSSVGLKSNQETYSMFNNAMSSGIYRRAFIYYLEPRTQTLRQKKDVVDESIIEYAVGNLKAFMSKSVNRLKGEDVCIYFDNEETYLYLDVIYEKLLDFSNKNINDERFSSEMGSLQKIVKLSALHAILHNRNITKEDIDYAYDFNIRCRATVSSLFNTEPPHKRIYKILKTSNQALSKSEVLERDIFQRSTFNEDIDLVSEYCYRKNEVLNIVGSKVKKYIITKLPENKLNEIIVSVCAENHGARSFDFIPIEIPFFDSENSLEKLVVTEKKDSFTLCHFNKKGKAQFGYRSIETAKPNQNCIAFDFDGGSRIEDTIELMKQFTYIIYTTKSHTEENHRYRLLLPTKTNFYVDNEQHKGLLKNIGDLLGLPTFDVSTRNIDRLWFTNPNAKVYTNKASLLDIECCIPETEIAEKQLVKADAENIDDITADKRIYGMIKYTIANAYKGNRNNALFRLYAFVKDLKPDEAGEITYRVNAMINDPLTEREIQKIIRRSIGY